MGDRTYTAIRFSGKITAEQAEELILELAGQGCQCDDGPEGDLTIEHLKLDQYFYDNECNYGQMEGVEDYCREQGIPYCKTWDAGGDYGPGMKVFTGSEEHECGTLDGDPVVTREMIIELGTGVLEYFDRFDFSSPRYPPIEIVDELSDEEKADQKHNTQMLDGCETEDERNAEMRHQTQGR